MWIFAVILKPLAALILLGAICAPIRWLIYKRFPEGRIKRFLLFPIKGAVGTKDWISATQKTAISRRSAKGGSEP